MKAYIFLNEADGNFFGYKPEHLKDLRMAGTLTGPHYDNPVDALEVIFQVCNGADPQSDVLWHGNRSLSVGDVVAFEIDGCLEAWACASVGWDRVRHFPMTITQVSTV